MLSGDLISNVQFQNMADLHRSHDAAMVLCCQGKLHTNTNMSRQRSHRAWHLTRDRTRDRTFLLVAHAHVHTP